MSGRAWRQTRKNQESLLPFEHALSRVLESVSWQLPAEKVPVRKALHRVLREDLRAGFNIPPFPKSAMDGYALRAEDTKGASPESPVELTVLEDIPAGRTATRKIKKGTAARIMTGAPLPPAADAVVMVEHTKTIESRNKVLALKSVKPGENIGLAGEDVKKGELVLASGTVIGPAVMGMISALGRKEVRVSRKPKAVVLSTGDELELPGRPLRKGRIYDANGMSILGLAQQAGCDARFLGIVRDRPDALIKKLERAGEADVVLLSGGVSVGDYDFVKDLLPELGVKEIFYKAKIKPGKPTYAGRKGKTLFFGLPGNPVSCMVCFHLFVRPALDKLMGKKEIGPRRMKARMACSLKLKPGRRKFLRASIVGHGPELLVRPYPDQKSGVLSSMVSAEVLIDAAGEATLLSEGELVDIILL